MSFTRDMIETLRISMGESKPMAEPKPATTVAAPPKQIFAPQPSASSSKFAKDAAEHTTALVGIGHIGTRYATDVVLQFQAELAVAHEAVYTELPESWARDNGLLSLQSQVSDHHEFLLRPDLGRRLNDESIRALNQAQKGIDVQPILADGLSAVACMQSGVDTIRALEQECKALGMTVGTPMCARYARVWLEDDIGARVNAKVAVIILGERPGLGTGDGLSAYMVYDPKIGNTDGNRNMISNIHQRGTRPPEAAKRLAALAEAMIQQQTSGVNLKLTGKLGEVAGGGYRAPEPRKRLVEVNR